MAKPRPTAAKEAADVARSDARSEEIDADVKDMNKRLLRVAELSLLIRRDVKASLPKMSADQIKATHRLLDDVQDGLDAVRTMI